MASTDSTPLPIKSQALRITFGLWLTTGLINTGAAGLDSEVSIDGGNNNRSPVFLRAHFLAEIFSKLKNGVRNLVIRSHSFLELNGKLRLPPLHDQKRLQRLHSNASLSATGNPLRYWAIYHLAVLFNSTSKKGDKYLKGGAVYLGSADTQPISPIFLRRSNNGNTSLSIKKTSTINQHSFSIWRGNESGMFLEWSPDYCLRITSTIPSCVVCNAQRARFNNASASLNLANTARSSRSGISGSSSVFSKVVKTAETSSVVRPTAIF